MDQLESIANSAPGPHSRHAPGTSKLQAQLLQQHHTLQQQHHTLHRAKRHEVSNVRIIPHRIRHHAPGPATAPQPTGPRRSKTMQHRHSPSTALQQHSSLQQQKRARRRDKRASRAHERSRPTHARPLDHTPAPRAEHDPDTPKLQGTHQPQPQHSTQAREAPTPAPPHLTTPEHDAKRPRARLRKGVRIIPIRHHAPDSATTPRASGPRSNSTLQHSHNPPTPLQQHKSLQQQKRARRRGERAARARER